MVSRPAPPRFGPLQRRLALVTVTGLLPLALLSFGVLVQSANDRKAQLLSAAQDTTRAIMTSVDGELSLSLASLEALSGSSRLKAADLAGFRAEAVELLARRPNWANVVLSTPEARQVLNARVPPGRPLPVAIDPDLVRAVAESGQPRVGHVLWSHVLQMHAFAVYVPIHQWGQLAYVLAAVVKPQSFVELLARQQVHEDGVVSVIDGNRRLIARSRGAATFLAREASPSLQQLLRQAGGPGWGITRTLEGHDVYTVVQRSAVGTWVVAMGIPVEALDAPVRRAYATLGGAILLSVLIGLAAAAFIARHIARPMRELELAAEAVGRGEAPGIPDTSLPEVRRVATALRAAHAERDKLLASEREARRQEEEARRYAENANRTKDEFLAMLGHELRNPLAALTSAAALLDRLGDRAPREAADEARAIIRRQARTLGRLTDDLLDAGRVMMGKVPLQRRPLDFAQAVRHAVDTLKRTPAFEGHAVTVLADAVWVNGDATRIEQMVSNLLTNAVKYTPAPGLVRVTVAREGPQAVLRVRDSGIGLERDLLPRVFDLFVQGRRSLERAPGGLGIGLTLVRRLAEQHGGSVEAESEGPGRGSEFVVRLPAIEAPADDGVLPTLAPSAGRGRRVVLIEDNRDARVTLRQLLELDGHQVLEAEDGLEGLDTVLREKPEVAVVDIGLPELDGFGVAKAIRENLGRGVRLIALTGYGVEHEARLAGDAGFDAFLIKPVDPDALSRLIAA